MEPFVGLQKISRWSRKCIVTEKIDGTNAQVFVTDDLAVVAGSRTKWITPIDDNYGFAGWVKDHEAELKTLGPGHHFGEWWGAGIQRKYGLKEKRFSLFNAARWAAQVQRPACCDVVPVLWTGPMDDLTTALPVVLENLRIQGSVAAPGFMDPEGVVIYHTAANVAFKKTFRGDEGKGATR